MHAAALIALLLAPAPAPAPAAAQERPSLAIQPAEARIEVDATHQLRLLPVDPGAGATVRWVSRDPAVATVDDAGLVRAVAPGSARILAIVGQQSVEARVRVPELPPTAVTGWRATSAATWSSDRAPRFSDA